MKWLARVMVAFLLLAIVMLAYASRAEWYYGGYPSNEEVQEFLTRFPTNSIRSQRVAQLKLLLWRLRFVDNRDDDDVAANAYQALSSYYLATHDDAVLEAVDATKTEGGVSCTICLFYERISKEREYLRWLKEHASAQNAVLRCDVWLTPEEVDGWLQNAKESK